MFVLKENFFSSYISKWRTELHLTGVTARQRSRLLHPSSCRQKNKIRDTNGPNRFPFYTTLTYGIATTFPKLTLQLYEFIGEGGKNQIWIFDPNKILDTIHKGVFGIQIILLS